MMKKFIYNDGSFWIQIKEQSELESFIAYLKLEDKRMFERMMKQVDMSDFHSLDNFTPDCLFLTSYLGVVKFRMLRKGGSLIQALSEYYHEYIKNIRYYFDSHGIININKYGGFNCDDLDSADFIEDHCIEL